MNIDEMTETNMSEILTIEKARGLAAQCWCEPETSDKEMDATLAEAFARKLMQAVNTRHVTPLQTAERAFIEAYREWHSGSKSLNEAMKSDRKLEATWNHLQQVEGESK
jgi:hypothetical protein